MAEAMKYALAFDLPEPEKEHSTMAKADQAGLPGIPQAPKRKVIAAMEEFGIEDDKLAAKLVKIGDERAENKQGAIDKMRELGIKIYTFERADGTLEDLVIEDVLRKRKSALNPKKDPKPKKDE